MEVNTPNSGSGQDGLPPVPPPPYPYSYPVAVPPAPAKKAKNKESSLVRSVFMTLGRLIILFSFLLNIYLLVIGADNFEQKTYRQGDYEHKIALIDLQGQIDMRTAGEFREKMIRAAEDPMVKGVILVINSPGGYVPPTELIHRYITDFKKTGKPVIAAIEQVGASGAYWAASAADKIYAQPNSIVGSIGVIYINMVLETALKEKLGIDPIVVKSTRSPFKDQMSFFRHPTEQELSDIKVELDRVHQRFVTTVSRGRNLPEEAVWPLADGDIHDGEEALQKKLIDKVGLLDDAVDDLAAELNLSNPRVVHLYTPLTFREMLLSKSFASSSNPLDIHAQLEQFAMTPKIAVLWLGE